MLRLRVSRLCIVTASVSTGVCEKPTRAEDSGYESLLGNAIGFFGGASGVASSAPAGQGCRFLAACFRFWAVLAAAEGSPGRWLEGLPPGRIALRSRVGVVGFERGRLSS